MRKKAKSFAVEEEQYDRLFALFRENYVEISISYCVNRYIKEFLEYLIVVQKEMKKDTSYTVPMTYIIETIAREPIFKKFDTESAIKEEVKELQKKYETYIRKNPGMESAFDKENIVKDGSFFKYLKAVMKIVAIEETKLCRELTDDEFAEKIKQYGGKGLQRYAIEDYYPKLERLKDITKRNKKRGDK
jgi:5'(3')-deoxyribonucleotidase